MNALLSLSSLLLVTFGSYLTFGILHHLGDWSQRRQVQCFVLAAPLVSLGIGVGGLCLRGIAPWDSLLGVALPLAMGLVAVGALGLGLIRLVLMAQVVACSNGMTDPELQALTNDLAKPLGLARPRVLLCIYHRPLAFTSGVFRPIILLSTWMVEHLDRRELEAVLNHELEHVARHDYFVTWLATVLRDAFQFSAAQSLVGAEETIKCRIERLLTAPEPPQNTHRSHAVILRMSISALVMLLLPGVANVTLMLVLMGCGPGLLLGKLL